MIALFLAFVGLAIILSCVRGAQVTTQPPPPEPEPDTRGDAALWALVVLALIAGLIGANILIGLSVAAGLR